MGEQATGEKKKKGAGVTWGEKEGPERRNNARRGVSGAPSVPTHPPTHLLDLLELVHAEDAPRVLAVLARLLAEARGDAGVAQRQRVLVHPPARVGMEIEPSGARE